MGKNRKREEWGGRGSRRQKETGKETVGGRVQMNECCYYYSLERMTDSKPAMPVNCTSVFLSRGGGGGLEKTFLKGLGLEV